MNSNRSSIPSFSEVPLTAKPHAFSGAVLTPTLARSLTPKRVLSFTHTLGVHALESSQAYASGGPNSASTDSSVGGNYYPSLSVGNLNSGKDNDFLVKEASETKVQYTVWILEAWRILDWAEPSAALFWEMATMYYTLYVAARTVQVVVESSSPEKNDDHRDDNNGDDTSPSHHGGIQRTFSHTIPPILSCGSSASMDSTSENPNQHTKSKSSYKHPSTSSSPSKKSDKIIQNKQSAASAKELPVWLVGTFLLLHCEEQAFQKNVSGEEEQRFGALMAKKNTSLDIFGSFLSPNLSISHKLHHDAWLDHAHCTSFLLRHLRKFLLLACVPHNSDALFALVQLANSTSAHDLEYTSRQDRNIKTGIAKYSTTDPEILWRRHEEEHGTIGFNVHMTAEDLERLNLILQAPLGGKINDPALLISDLMPQEELAVYGGISLEAVEQELQRHLENDLMSSMNDNNSQEDKNSEVTSDLGKLSLEDNHDHEYDRVKFKELSYLKIRGSTVYLQPNKPVLKSMAQDGSLMGSGRLHDVRISGCLDAHLYLLQPFEHATISCCIGCTIVIGALAGLVDLVDCERCTITVAARRVLVSNCYDVTLSIFTPSPPLLCGDNRNCKFAPYNTYYDGLRENLLSTGLAAALLSTENAIIVDPLYGPALQCASNKWKIPIELSKMFQGLQPVPRSSSPIPGASADEKSLGTDDTVKISTLVPASDFEVLIIPFLTATAAERHRKEEMKLGDDVSTDLMDGTKHGLGAQYCQNLADVLQLCPFRLPTEYERRVVAKADRVKTLQQAIQTELSLDQQAKLAEELNQGFRDWLVTSGNLRQILDLVRHDRSRVELMNE